MLSFKKLSCYSFIAFPLAAAFITLQVLIPTHYAEVTSLSLSTIGGVILIARLWDTVTDPIIGVLSDRTRSRIGRRKLWIIISIPFICVSTYMLFNPSENTSVSYLLLWTFIIYLSGTMAIVPLNAWGAELSMDYQQRNRITSIRAFYGLFGTLIALSITALLSDTSLTNTSTLNLNNALFAITSLIIFSLLIAATLLFFVEDKQEIKLPSQQFHAALSLIKTPSPFRTLLFSFLFNSIANAIPATLFLFYVGDVLMASASAGSLLFIYFVCTTISLPLWVKIASRYGKHQTWMGSILIACLFFSCTPFLGPDELWLYIMIVIVTGITTGCDLIIPASMNGDLIEWDAANSGYKRPGLFFALWGTTTKLAYALAIGIAFPLLDSFGFSASNNNSEHTLTALAWMYGLPCILLKLIAVAAMKNYPITQMEYQTLLERAKQQPRPHHADRPANS